MAERIKVGVLGAAGRMGRTVCEAVEGDPELELVAAVDVASGDADGVAGIVSDGLAGAEIAEGGAGSGAGLAGAVGGMDGDAGLAGGGSGGGGLLVGSDIGCFLEAGVEVAVDFTTRDAAIANLRWLATNGIHAVVGTTGFSDADIAEVSSLFGSQDGDGGMGSGGASRSESGKKSDDGESVGSGGVDTKANCVIAPNFAISAVLMMRFAELAAPHFSSAEIIEYHHDKKIDAPSGTALATMRRIEAASGNWNPDPTKSENLPGARGGSGDKGVRVHAVRAEGFVAHQEVIMGGPGQSLTIRQDSYDRVSFMPGVLMAVKAVSDRPGLTLGLDAILGI